MKRNLLAIICLLALLVAGCAAPQGPDSAPAAEPTAAAPPTAEPAPTIAPSPTTAPAPTTVPTAAPTHTPVPAEVAVISDVPYAEALDPDLGQQLLDIYYTPGMAENKPVVLWAHGSSLDKSTGRIMGRILAKEGYVVIPFTWLTAEPGEAVEKVRAATEYAECVLRFAAAEAGQYGADPQRVIWTGFSAGSWLGAILALSEDGSVQEEWDSYAAANDGPPQQVRCAAAAEPAAITALVAGAGSYADEFWLDGNEVPSLKEWHAPLKSLAAIGHNPELVVRLLHGKSDHSPFTDFDDAERFAAALAEAGYDVTFLPQNGAHESFQTEIIEQVKALP
jgi:acetyl esterase/lipase